MQDDGSSGNNEEAFLEGAEELLVHQNETALPINDIFVLSGVQTIKENAVDDKKETSKEVQIKRMYNKRYFVKYDSGCSLN